MAITIDKSQSVGVGEKSVEAVLSKIDAEKLSDRQKQEIHAGIKKLVLALRENEKIGTVQQYYNSVVEMVKDVPNQDLPELSSLLKALRDLGKSFGRDIG